MQATPSAPGWSRLVPIGMICIVLGVAWIVAGAAGIDPLGELGSAGWPALIILPGLMLVLAALVADREHAVGLAIPGAIVTTVGLVLLYQSTTGHWESWAYAWTLVGPGAAGLALLGVGLRFGDREALRTGGWLATVAAVLFALGAWYFEAIFRDGQPPLDINGWWPVALVIVGLVALALGMRTRGQPGSGGSPAGSLQ